MAHSTTVDDATLVHISVKDVGSNTFKLGIFPVRVGDTIAFYTKPSAVRSPERPREVVWVGHGLKNGMTIRIQPKAGAPALFPNAPYTLTDIDPIQHSGDVLRAKVGGELWPYDVLLFDSAGQQLDCIDPDVVVQPDP